MYIDELQPLTKLVDMEENREERLKGEDEEVDLESIKRGLEDSAFKALMHSPRNGYVRKTYSPEGDGLWIYVEVYIPQKRPQGG